MAEGPQRERCCQRSKHAPYLDDAPEPPPSTTTSPPALRQHEAQLKTRASHRHSRGGSAPRRDDALLRAPFTPSTSREESTARLGPLPAGARTLRRLPGPGGTELRHVPPHCSRDLGTGTARGRGICPGSRRPRAPRPVRGVGLGLFVMRFPCFSLCDPRLFVNLRL